MFNTYASIMAQRDELFQNVTLSKASSFLGMAGAGFGAVNGFTNLGEQWSGKSQQAQGAQAAGYADKGQKIVSSATTFQQYVTAGQQQLHNAKVRLVGLTKQAKGEGFDVWPTGTVTLSFQQERAIAILAHHNQLAAMKMQEKLTTRAADLTAQIDLVVFQTNMADAQVAFTMATQVANILGTLTRKDASSASPTQPSTSLPITQPTAPTVGGTPPLTVAGTGNGTGLASATGFDVGNAKNLGLTGVNASSLGGTAGLAPGSIAPRGAVGGVVPGGAGTAPGMMYGGAPMAGGHAGGQRGHHGNDWLEEDGEYDTAEAANEAGGVLS
jgi:hypothetical protein